MILRSGNMWNVFGNTDLFLITTNPIINKKGAAVMGRGIALEAAKRFPRLPYDFAQKLMKLLHLHPSYRDNVISIGRYEGQHVGSFMVKRHWKERASLDVIKKSVDDLLNVIDYRARVAPPFKRIDLNFPGVGNGKLSQEGVLPASHSSVCKSLALAPDSIASVR